MNRYLLSSAADADLRDIIKDTIQRWGFDRAERYAGELNHAFATLAAFPAIGRNAGYIRPAYLTEAIAFSTRKPATAS